ncbi:hypothetical protein F0562_003621 [Nyssa sinensis]|uniref:Retrovirus-related Pol polyprotein from transposon TNT 1-94-like beta-barrel domain-containing protein n=1 Tax=Nyssa sinensis TaxID=561372 RepID=A0A5J5BZ71_9ASTE|nr:hypothetical protein F0562_003621 [Nyssa sinensis]
MKSGECITYYFSRVMMISNKMRFHGEQMRDVTIVEKILRSLTDNFNYIVCSIEESKDTDTLTIDEFQSSLIVYEQKFHKKPVEEQALKYDFPTWNKEANYAELEEHEDVLLMTYVEEHDAMRNDVWFLDSGCSNHRCGDARMFSELDESFKQQVKLRNNSRIIVKGRGNVRLQLNGFNHVLTAVFYVPELKNNLLSIGQLQEKGLAILIHGELCKIYHLDKGLIIQTAMSENRIFTLLANTEEKKEVCFQASAQELYHLWHRRYGYLICKGLNILQTKNMVRGLPHLLPTTYEEQVLVDLEWGDDDKNDTDDDEGDENLEAASEGNEEVEGNENHAATNDALAEGFDANDALVEGSDVRERRVRRAPIWMEDYISDETTTMRRIPNWRENMELCFWDRLCKVRWRGCFRRWR